MHMQLPTTMIIPGDRRPSGTTSTTDNWQSVTTTTAVDASEYNHRPLPSSHARSTGLRASAPNLVWQQE